MTSTQIESFGTGADGREVQLVRLDNGTLSAAILTRGAILQDLRLADVAHPLTLGAADLAAYEGPMASFGGIIGPVVNRIAGGMAEVAGRTCQFELRPGERCTLHSGSAGTHRKVWEILRAEPAAVAMSVDLPDGEGGFPGNRRLVVAWELDGPELRLTVDATTDAPTLMNVAHHGYWNLGGGADWSGHRLRVAADEVLEIDSDVVPTGERLPVQGTGYDFREGQKIVPGKTVKLDKNFCLAEGRRDLTDILWLDGPTGVTMTVATTEPGVQVYDGHGVKAAPHPGHDGVPYGPFCGLAIEPQFWPDAPNHANFPSIRLDPGDAWRQVTTFRFAAPCGGGGPAAVGTSHAGEGVSGSGWRENR